MLLLDVEGRRGPIRGTEDRHRLSVQQQRLFMVLALMLGDFQRDACHEQPIYVVGIPHTSGIAVFRGVDNHANGEAVNGKCTDGCIRDGGVRNAEHIDIQLHLFRINGAL